MRCVLLIGDPQPLLGGSHFDSSGVQVSAQCIDAVYALRNS